jgi:hypothetical protein
MHSPRTWPAKTEFAKLYYVPAEAKAWSRYTPVFTR